MCDTHGKLRKQIDAFINEKSFSLHIRCALNRDRKGRGEREKSNKEKVFQILFCEKYYFGRVKIIIFKKLITKYSKCYIKNKKNHEYKPLGIDSNKCRYDKLKIKKRG